MAISVPSGQIIPAFLADGQLTSTKTVIYESPSGYATHVTIITLANTHTAAVTVNLYARQWGSVSRRVIGKDYSLDVGESLEFPAKASAFRLNDGDVFEADASVDNVIDYCVSGGLEEYGMDIPS